MVLEQHFTLQGRVPVAPGPLHTAAFPTLRGGHTGLQQARAASLLGTPCAAGGWVGACPCGMVGRLDGVRAEQWLTHSCRWAARSSGALGCHCGRTVAWEPREVSRGHAALQGNRRNTGFSRGAVGEHCGSVPSCDEICQLNLVTLTWPRSRKGVAWLPLAPRT